MIYQNAILNIAGILISNVIITLGYIIVSRVLGPIKMGQYSYFIWMISIGVLLSSGGISMALSKYIPELQKKYSQKEQIDALTKILFLFAIILSVIAACFIAFIFPFIKHAQSYITSLYLIALAIPFVSITVIITAYLQGHNRFKLLSVFTIINSFVYISCITIATLVYKQINAILIAYCISYAIIVSLYLYGTKLHRREKHVVILDKKIIHEITRYIFSVSLIILFDTIVWDKSEVFFLKRFTQDQQVAFYTIAYTFVTKISSLIPAALTSVLIPAYSALLDTQKEQHTIYYKSSKYLALFIFPVALGGAALATPIIKYFLGSQYIGGIGTLRVMFVGCIFGVISSSGSALMYSVKKQNIILYVGFALALMSIGIDLLIIPRFASIGAASANAFVQLLGAWIGTLYITKKLQLHFPWKEVIATGTIASIMGIVVYAYATIFQNAFTFISSILLGAAIYIGLILCFHILDKEDLTLCYNIYMYLKEALVRKQNNHQSVGLK